VVGLPLTAGLRRTVEVGRTVEVVSSAAPRTYEVRTYGCQMNVHDSERIAGLLDAAGYVPATDARPDVVVFNTCAVRENADNRLYGNLGHLKPVKDATPGMQIAVGGCLAQKDQSTITRRAPWVDVVFGTHNVGSLPTLLERARIEQESQVELLEALEVFPSTLPARRESTYAAWVSISVGCDNTCTFCIVPSLRGKERDRRPAEVLAEVEMLAAQGVLEVTLLGQNVNSYGREFGDRNAFAALLRAVGRTGVERVRFTSPHPRDFHSSVIAAMAETPAVCPSLHMPLQSGSDAVLRAMRRSYRSERFLGILDRVRAAIPDAAITTDIIVGFPAETEADFADTLRVVEASRFAGAFTFQYSPRPGTPAAALPALPKQVVQERYERLVALQDQITYDGMRAQVGRAVEVLVSQGEGRKDAPGHLTGRARDNRLVHLAPADGVRPGDVVQTVVTKAGPHYLVADGPLLRHRRTAAGDASAAGRSPSTPGVLLGLPTVGVPAPLPVAAGCAR
jgi:tRNA-2-methylthio-N6-dimethylallyladenosine synthase